MTDRSDTPARLRPWLRAVLFTSLAMNFLVVGLAAGLWLRGGPDLRARGHDTALPYVRALLPEQRRDIGKAIREGRSAPRGAHRSIIADYDAAIALLRADPFDAAAFGALLSEQASRAAARRDRAQAALTRHLADLPLTARRAYADRLEAEAQGLHRRWRDGAARD